MNINIVDIMDNLKEEVEKQFNNKITGFLYIKGLFMLHFFEGKSEAINEFMSKLFKETQLEKGYIQFCKVICFTEENPTR